MKDMHFEAEELVPIVAELSVKMTGYESSSITYEKAQQLMEAVLYCIQELGMSAGEGVLLEGDISAQVAYARGYECVIQKIRAALELYHSILPSFLSFGNRCLEETFLKGMPAFFQWYDPKFRPQDTILTLDYPVLKTMQGLSGVDAIYEYLRCIRQEQIFLNAVDSDAVLWILNRYSAEHVDIIENLSQIVFSNIVRHLLAEGSYTQPEFSEQSFSDLGQIVSRYSKMELELILREKAAIFLRTCCGAGNELTDYLSLCISDIATGLKLGGLLNLRY